MNNIVRIVCSSKDCNKVFLKEWDEYGFSYISLGTLPIDNDDKQEKIWFALMKTRLFCSNCCELYAKSICNNSISENS
jgi:phosphosulfolactate synthase (CoM biosynthesis protein A)